ncbi:DNA translocase FtsK [Fluviibacter phosphoraccumulans]|uniref:DNA translocase FtsK n=1 Tax=Fluviibacter phosphoraccumulans TaxID=1751046 RepID=UPI0024E23C3A|nr:DNA translocase FtsK [Fluviibacter phosphoraccumulans]
MTRLFSRSVTQRIDGPRTLPERIRALMQEARWAVLGFVALVAILALWGFDPADPAWSHSGPAGRVTNPMGRFGAWMSDLLFYLFGGAAWLWALLPLVLILIGWSARQRALREAVEPEVRPLWLTLSGFLALLVCVSTFAALRFHTSGSTMPMGPGGVLGEGLSTWIGNAFGFTGATLIVGTLLLLSWRIFSGLPWVVLFEQTGALMERAVGGGGRAVESWQDRRIGKEVAQQREATVEQKRAEPMEPVFIEPAAPVEVPVSRKATQRKEREKQVPLFPEAVVGGTLPPLSLLDPAQPPTDMPTEETMQFTSRLIETRLADFGVEVKVIAAYPGPVITRYEIEPAVGVKGSQIVNLARDLARALAMVSVRVVETVPGKSCMALELPNPKRQTVRLSEILSSRPYHNMSSPLTVALGKDIGGVPIVADLAKMPHLLVAGTTGSGKSVGVNAMILSMLYKSEPDAVRLILVDPKMLELSIYEGIPHLLAPVVTDMRQAANALTWCVAEMERRYKIMSKLGVRNLASANEHIQKAAEKGEPIPNPLTLTPEAPEPLRSMPHIVVVIDELADLMMVAGKKVEELIARLAQKARASGIHLILATQRPSVDVITGLIKANIPTRIAFQVSSKIDSRTILDQMGAEALLGQGDMLYLPPGTGYPQRVHGAFVADEEVHRVVDYLKSMGAPEYEEGILTGATECEGGDGEGGDNDAEADPLYDQAVEIVLKNRRASISLVQRHLRIGYNRSARLIEAMEKAGLVSTMDGRGGREVLAPNRAGDE